MLQIPHWTESREPHTQMPLFPTVVCIYPDSVRLFEEQGRILSLGHKTMETISHEQRNGSSVCPINTEHTENRSNKGSLTFRGHFAFLRRIGIPVSGNTGLVRSQRNDGLVPTSRTRDGPQRYPLNWQHKRS